MSQLLASFHRLIGVITHVFCLSLFCACAIAADYTPRPNILFCIADDWGWPHAGAYGDPVVQTPTFDRLARGGVLFQNAYVTSPSCTPSRGSILTGQWHWRLGAGANLHCIFPDKFATYPELLSQKGYITGTSGKAWGPGRTQTPNRPLAGKRYKNFTQFLAQRQMGQPFCFWLGSSDPHRPYEAGSGAASGMKVENIRVPACLPDDEVVRSDLADYYYEVQRFDRLVGEAVAALESTGELDNTLILVTGDHGFPFPRGKGNLYDSGVRVPLVAHWPKGIGAAGRTVDDFVSLVDLAPTFLELAGVAIPGEVSGRRIANLLASSDSGRIDPSRDHVLFGKERHVPCQEAPDMGGYPCRGLRTHDYLFIRNFTPDRWPNGTPRWEQSTIKGVWLGDCDNGPSKTYLVKNKNRDKAASRLYDLAFAKRPAEELYDLRTDPDQLVNLADDPMHAAAKKKLSEQLTAELKATGDLRVLGRGSEYETHPFLGHGPRHPDWERQREN